MAPFTAWLPVRPHQGNDLVVKIVGKGAVVHAVEINAVLNALTEQGFEVMAQADWRGRPSSLSGVQLRVALQPFHSMGDGCDVLVYLDAAVPDFGRFGLQRGSVLLCAPRAQDRPMPIPKGVIAYPVPFAKLSRQCGEVSSGTGLIAAGVLSHLLGISEQVRAHIFPTVRLRYFDAGVTYARECLVKRDLYTLPAPPTARRQVLLDTDQAMMLGFGIGSCHCGPACASELDRSPLEWVGTHLDTARQIVSFVKPPTSSGIRVYRGPRGAVMGLTGSLRPSLAAMKGRSPKRLVCVAANVPDAIRLVSGATQLGGNSDAGQVWVVADQMLAQRFQSVAVETLEKTMKALEEGNEVLVRAERDGERGADVGYIAWGTPQGVVRDAVALCRSFGLRVAALYPKMLQPLPVEELETFAATVRRVVVVEPDRTGRFTNLIKRFTSVRPATVMSKLGKVLTPMDIFMREGLGV